MRHELQVEAIGKSYPEGRERRRVLHDVSMSIASGELTLICGPSGCGKSTLLAIASGLLRPDTGRVHALGEDLWRKDLAALEHFRLHHTGFVFQQCNLFPALRAWEQVALPLHYLGFSATEGRARGSEAGEKSSAEAHCPPGPGAIERSEFREHARPRSDYKTRRNDDDAHASIKCTRLFRADAAASGLPQTRTKPEPKNSRRRLRRSRRSRFAFGSHSAPVRYGS